MTSLIQVNACALIPVSAAKKKFDERKTKSLLSICAVFSRIMPFVATASTTSDSTTPEEVGRGFYDIYFNVWMKFPCRLKELFVGQTRAMCKLKFTTDNSLTLRQLLNTVILKMLKLILEAAL